MWCQLNFNKLRSYINVLAVLIVLSCVGCGPEPEPVGTIIGKVMSGDTVIGTCKVAVTDPLTLKNRAATVDAEGNFKIENMPYAEYKVRVYPKQDSGPEEVFDKRLPQKMQSFKTSGVTVTVQSEENPLEIDLKQAP